tara:strand:+ start:12473 stop:12820 length:348 start_codon:yes stop_codon:yes gene_type:complete
MTIMKSTLNIISVLVMSVGSQFATGAHATFFLPKRECSSGIVPYCINDVSTFEDHAEYELCKEQMEQYLREEQEYVSCLNQMRSSALDQIHERTKLWHCRSEKFGFDAPTASCSD